jgi:hypothetical protein
MNWKGCGRKWSWPILRHCLSICLEIEENHVLGLRFQLVTSQMWRNAKDMAVTFDNNMAVI